LYFGIDQMLKSLLDPKNPIFISILIASIITVTIYWIFKYIINPSYKKFIEEKHNLELESARLMALFAELDPDPVIRIDPSGTIIETNKAAKEVFSITDLKGKNISELLPLISYKADEKIFNQTKIYTQQIANKHYSILLRGDTNLQLTQIYFRDITELKNYEEKLLDYQTKLKKLSDHLQSLIEEERIRIARGLHDGIGQCLSLMRIKLSRMMEDSTDMIHTQNYNTLIVNLDDIIKEVRTISYSLKPKTLEEMGLSIALKTLINKVANETGIHCDYNIVGEETRFNEKLEIMIYRVVQEAINNIVKHAKATHFSVQFIKSEKMLRIIISDNGNGFNVEEVLKKKSGMTSMGLLNMKERIESFNGNLKIESSTSIGTIIISEIPIIE
jgi:signal transduction histidine kinase